MNALYHYDTPVGRITLAEDGDAITHLLFGEQALDGYERCETPLLQTALKQLNEYFDGARRDFSLPLAPRGTDFQLTVWQALCAVPYGETRSYREIAEAIGKPGAVRAVGGANNRNPIAIIVPCHRVLGADGSLTGYAGGLDIKALLLHLERKGMPVGQYAGTVGAQPVST